MGWWFGRKSAPADARPFVPAWLQNDATEVGFARSYSEQVEEVYRRNPVGQRAVRLVAGMLGQLTVDGDAQAVALVQREGLLESIAANLLLHGNAYVQLIADGRDEPAAKIQLEVAADAGPASLRLSYYDPTRDFQAAEARASMSDEAGMEQVAELPAVIDSSSARSIAEDLLGRRWAEREILKLRLPPAFLALEPGAIVGLESHPGQLWRVGRCTLDRFAVIAELRRHRAPIVTGEPALLASSAISALGAAAQPDSGELRLALFEVPSLEQPQTQPVLVLAASSSVSAWRPQPARLEIGGHALQISTARRKSTLGYSITPISAGASGQHDLNSTFEVQLVDREQWLTSCDDAALACGANLAILGREVLQFGDAYPLGDGRFRLSRLVRGGAGTETPAHPEGEAFTLAEPASLRTIALPSWCEGKQAIVRARKLSGGEVTASAVVPTPPGAAAMEIEGSKTIRRELPAITSPAGGSTVDSEARTALDAVLETMRRQGLIES